MLSSKRARTPPTSDSRPPSPGPTPKAVKTSLHNSDTSSTSRPVECTLPPTCNLPGRSTVLANSNELEKHYAKYHAHVCEERGCGCVFPEERLLELHQTECHDPIAAVRKDRGEKIFACHLPTCPRLFPTPKARRLHLIQAHGYPKEYFFAVTNKGVGGLLKKWGEGASMIRGAWKPRDQADDDDDRDGHGDDDEDADGDKAGGGRDEETNNQLEPERMQVVPSNPTTDPEPRSRSTIVIEEDSSEEEEEESSVSQSSGSLSGDGEAEQKEDGGRDNVEGLANAMDTLSLVPPSIQFGRGAKRGGFTNRGRGGASPSYGNGGPEGRGNGRGGRRGRGRGRGARGGREGGRDDQRTPTQNHPLPPPPRATRPPVPPRGLGGNKRGGFPNRGVISGRGIIMRGGSSGK